MTIAAPSYILSTIEGMRTDLPHIEAAIRWAWGEAWELPTRAASEHGQIHRPLTVEEQAAADVDDCRVPGPKFDLGVGNHKARHAIETAGPRLAACDQALDDACLLAAQPADRQLPIVQTAGAMATLPELIAITVSINWRLWFIQDRTIGLPLPTAKAALAHVSRANRKLLAARGPLDRAMRTGKQTTEAPAADDLCNVCNKRPRLRDRKRCSACHMWKQRHGHDRNNEAAA